MPHIGLTILSGGAVQIGLESAAKLFQDKTGHRLNLSFATAPVLRHKIETHEVSVDIVIAPAELTEGFERQGHTVAGSRAVIGSVKAGIVVRSGAPKPDISTAEALKNEIVACRLLVYNEGSSGIFVEKLMERLGIAEEVKVKPVRLPDADAVMRHLANGQIEKEIGFGQLTAIALRAHQGGSAGWPTTQRDRKRHDLWRRGLFPFPGARTGAAVYLFSSNPCGNSGFQSQRGGAAIRWKRRVEYRRGDRIPGRRDLPG